jgi:hypothetical protein
VIASVEGIITGLAAVGEWRPEIKTANPDVKSNYSGYAGYIRDARNSAPIKVFGVVGVMSDEACLLATVDRGQ